MYDKIYYNRKKIKIKKRRRKKQKENKIWWLS